MFFRLLSHPLYVFFFLSSACLYAKEPWFLREVFNTHSIKPNAAYYINDADLFECGIESLVLCSDEVSYYNTKLFLELYIENEEVEKVVMSLAFSMNDYSQMQLNLRKDGFQLEEVTINGETFNVTNAILAYENEMAVSPSEKTSSKSHLLSKINKQLVEFINSQPKDTVSTSVWRVADETSPIVILESDATDIRLSLERSN